MAAATRVDAEGTADAVTFRGDGGHRRARLRRASPSSAPAAAVAVLRVIAGAGDDDVGASGPLTGRASTSAPATDEFDAAVPDGRCARRR